MSIKIIFCDTNALFGVFMRIVKGNPITHSALFEAAKTNDLYISQGIIDEMKKIFFRDHSIIVSDDHVSEFFCLSGFKLIRSSSQDISLEVSLYVHDKNDAFVLQDAVSVQADYLLTKNTKDFDIEGIYETYKMSVVSALPLELFFDL